MKTIRKDRGTHVYISKHLEDSEMVTFSNICRVVLNNGTGVIRLVFESGAELCIYHDFQFNLAYSTLLNKANIAIKRAARAERARE